MIAEAWTTWTSQKDIIMLSNKHTVKSVWNLGGSERKKIDDKAHSNLLLGLDVLSKVKRGKLTLVLWLERLIFIHLTEGILLDETWIWLLLPFLITRSRLFCQFSVSTHFLNTSPSPPPSPQSPLLSLSLSLTPWLYFGDCTCHSCIPLHCWLADSSEACSRRLKLLIMSAALTKHWLYTIQHKLRHTAHVYMYTIKKCLMSKSLTI